MTIYGRDGPKTTELRSYLSHRRRWAPPVHEATGGHCLQTVPSVKV